MVDGSGMRRSLRRAGIAGFAIAASLASMALMPGAAPAASIPGGSGPFDSIFAGTDLVCQLYRDEGPEFDGGAEENYCGTFISSDSVLYGTGGAGPGVGSTAPYNLISQTPVDGSGTPADPYKVTTVVETPGVLATAAAPAQGEEGKAILRLTQVDTYVTGQDFYRSDITVQNLADFEQDPILYHAADCRVQHNDQGFAVEDTALGTAFCTPRQFDEVELTAFNFQGDDHSILGFVPIGANSHYLEDEADEGGPLYDDLHNGDEFPDDCVDCDLNAQDPEESVDNGTGLSWAFHLPVNGSVTRCFYTVDSRSGSVPPATSACGPAASPPGTIAQKPSSCKLRISRARIFLFARHPRMRLVARYRSSEPADVNIDYVAVKNGHKVPLGEVVKHFGKHGLFRLRKELTESDAESLRSTDRFIVHFKIPGEPGFCARQYTKNLTVPRIVEGQRVVFQEDSKFPQPGAGHPES
jgi:hypothetical protein